MSVVGAAGPQRGQVGLDGVDRDGEAEARAAGRRGVRTGGVHRGVDADDVAVHVDERAAGVARVQGRVRLDRLVRRRRRAGVAVELLAAELERPLAVAAALTLPLALALALLRRDGHVAVQGGDDAAGDGAGETLGGADRHDLVADLDAVGVAEGGHSQAGGVLQLDEGEVLLAVGADDLRGVGLAVAGAHLDGGGSGDDVVVGDDLAVAGDDHAGAGGLTGVRGGVDLDDARADRLGDPGDRALGGGRHHIGAGAAAGGDRVVAGQLLDAVGGAASYRRGDDRAGGGGGGGAGGAFLGGGRGGRGGGREKKGGPAAVAVTAVGTGALGGEGGGLVLPAARPHGRRLDDRLLNRRRGRLGRRGRPLGV